MQRSSLFALGPILMALGGCGDGSDLTLGGAGSTTTSTGGTSTGGTSTAGTSTGASNTGGTNTGGTNTGGTNTGGTNTGGTNTGGTGTGGSTGGTGGMGNPMCGNSNVDYMLGEECDDGNNVSGDGCSATCKLEAAPTCGDGKLDLVNDEECDDGNVVAGDGCSPACQLELVGQACGNGGVQAPEVCDDGNLFNNDGCNPTCNLKGTTTLFAGSPGMGGTADGVGMAARFGGVGVLAANTTHLFIGEEGSPMVGARLRSVTIANATVTTIAGSAAAPPGFVDDPVGTNARFGSCEALTTDGFTIWAADGANSRIRAISATAPHAVTTACGTGNAAYADGDCSVVGYQGIRGLTYYNGHVYFLDPMAATLRRYDPATSMVVTLAGSPGLTGQQDGFGSNARFISPRYMVSDGSGMLYISDTNGNKIRAYNTVTTEVTTFAGDGTCGYVDAVGVNARVHRPRGMASDGTSIYFTEFNAHAIRQGVVATKDVSTLTGSIAMWACVIDCSCGAAGAPGAYAEGTGNAALFTGPFGLVYHYPSNSLFVMDSGNYVLRRIQ